MEREDIPPGTILTPRPRVWRVIAVHPWHPTTEHKVYDFHVEMEADDGTRISVSAREVERWLEPQRAESEPDA